MSNVRLIARLDIKGPNLIKGIHLEGLRVVGNPNEFAMEYYSQGADELIYMDTVASLYGRNNLSDIVKTTAENVFIPITVGGGIRTVDDVKQLLRCGADKVAINTAATKNPSLLTDIARRFGSQCVVLSIEAKRTLDGRWEVLTDNGREHTSMDVVDWARNGEEFGAGEILLTSVDQEGTRKGFDLELVKQVSEAVSIPVIASGGMGRLEDLTDVIHEGKADAVAMADVLHYKRLSLAEIRKHALDNDIHVRTL
ncbi:glycosyl amidation-associated protein WbuZ [Legionella worsleiensis]|uniref:imidazole glycerol-phosphate synthase n=1 Tax=Legionella worsleiensis TaxID=45076 RepID=A0A0W1A3A4_9GAMM|nr:glycosyl amidation-associated protein WbuZ [Legionella worsleiensis]KTD75847.1 imidazole glycerol phosphate synthase subunit HisF [Legionella worsleiensis]STY32860.1 imidazole glycerol phosphate synthase subunit HisF [Legionella worsleiensis]